MSQHLIKVIDNELLKKRNKVKKYYRYQKLMKNKNELYQLRFILFNLRLVSIEPYLSINKFWNIASNGSVSP